MRIKVLVLYSVLLRTLLQMHFCACFFTCMLVHVHLSDPSVVLRAFKNVVANALLRMFFYTFVHVHLSECVCACLLICIKVLGL
ncbi:hypothetical protein MIMGU_mgv11b021283mg [Erythranthe guttata]|uniref:Uncharacterized protein n=1 Tax=Erythranthe guttata TaxID=4155 RepID=A0A022QE43_ERYGU|nr:hypothetical protein MIMGU_mgv11b021283mg [Erythranthe guttata]